MALQLAAPSAVIPAALALFLFGIPHGSVQREQSSARRVAPGLSYTALYLLFGVLVFCSWMIEPWPTLLLALGLSAWHFSTSSAREPLLIGVFVITASFVVFPSLTLEVFNALTGRAIAVSDVWLRALGLFGLAAVWWPGGHARWPVRLLWSAMFLTLHPVAAVACYFALSHALGETASLLEQEDDGTTGAVTRTLARIYGPTSLPALLGAVAVIAGVALGYVPLPIAAGFAVAFIVPHMLPLERLLR